MKGQDKKTEQKKTPSQTGAKGPQAAPAGKPQTGKQEQPKR